MSKRKKTYQKKTFESDGTPSDVSANIYMSMVLSPAWKDLTANQRQLYLYCKMQYYGEKKKPTDNPLEFTMNRTKWADLYGLYKRNNSYSFTRDMAALIEHGFVVCSSCGATTRTKSIYRFSDKWQKWGTNDFYLDRSEMTLSMLRKNQK